MCCWVRVVVRFENQIGTSSHLFLASRVELKTMAKLGNEGGGGGLSSGFGGFGGSSGGVSFGGASSIGDGGRGRGYTPSGGLSGQPRSFADQSTSWGPKPGGSGLGGGAPLKSFTDQSSTWGPKPGGGAPPKSFADQSSAWAPGPSKSPGMGPMAMGAEPILDDGAYNEGVLDHVTLLDVHGLSFMCVCVFFLYFLL